MRIQTTPQILQETLAKDFGISDPSSIEVLSLTPESIENGDSFHAEVKLSDGLKLRLGGEWDWQIGAKEPVLSHVEPEWAVPTFPQPAFRTAEQWMQARVAEELNIADPRLIEVLEMPHNRAPEEPFDATVRLPNHEKFRVSGHWSSEFIPKPLIETISPEKSV